MHDPIPYYYSLETVWLEFPMRFHEFFNGKPLLYLVILSLFSLGLVKWLPRLRVKYHYYRLRIIALFILMTLTLIGAQLYEYNVDIELFNAKHLHQDILTKELIYQVKNDRPYTPKESFFLKTNALYVLKNLKAHNVLSEQELRRSFNLIKKVVLDAQRRELYIKAIQEKNTEVCQKDQTHDLYRCRNILYHNNGTRTYAEVIVYQSLKAYQDYALNGFQSEG